MRIRHISFVLCAGITLFGTAGCGGKTDSAHRPVPKAMIGLSEPKFESPVRAANDPPEIVALGLSRDTFGSGDTVTGWLISSTNVAAAQARVESYALPLHRERPGHFSLEVKIPNLPSFVKRDYTMVVSVTNPAGAVEKVNVPIHVR